MRASVSRLKIENKIQDDFIILTIKGQMIGGRDTENVFGEVTRLLEDGHQYFIVDLKHLHWINSTGLGFLISAYNRIKDKGGQMVLVGMPKRLVQMMETTKLTLIFATYKSLDEAIEAHEQSK